MAFEVQRLKNHEQNSKTDIYFITELTKKRLLSWLEEEIHHHEAKEKPVVEHNTWDSRPR